MAKVNIFTLQQNLTRLIGTWRKNGDETWIMLQPPLHIAVTFVMTLCGIIDMSFVVALQCQAFFHSSKEGAKIQYIVAQEDLTKMMQISLKVHTGMEGYNTHTTYFITYFPVSMRVTGLLGTKNKQTLIII